MDVLSDMENENFEIREEEIENFFDENSKIEPEKEKKEMENEFLCTKDIIKFSKQILPSNTETINESQNEEVKEDQIQRNEIHKRSSETQVSFKSHNQEIEKEIEEEKEEEILTKEIHKTNHNGNSIDTTYISDINASTISSKKASYEMILPLRSNLLQVLDKILLATTKELEESPEQDEELVKAKRQRDSLYESYVKISKEINGMKNKLSLFSGNESSSFLIQCSSQEIQCKGIIV